MYFDFYHAGNVHVVFFGLISYEELQFHCLIQ